MSKSTDQTFEDILADLELKFQQLQIPNLPRPQDDTSKNRPPSSSNFSSRFLSNDSRVSQTAVNPRPSTKIDFEELDSKFKFFLISFLFFLNRKSFFTKQFSQYFCRYRSP
jgi:hypothetical protein